MSTTRYEVYCETESKFIYTWSDTLISTCPNDGAHTILSGSVRAVESFPSVITPIAQESTPTGGSFSVQTRILEVPAGQTENYDESWPYPVNCLSLLFHTPHRAQGDVLSLSVAPCTTTGVITANVAVDDTVINVSATVIQYIRHGYYVCLTDGTNSTEDIRVNSVDPVNNTITLETGSTHAFSAATPTYIKQTVYFFKDMELDGDRTYDIGGVTLTSSHIPANTIVRVTYTNKSPTFPAKFKGMVQYLY